jgi:outer membrane protein OmpA-like peptidoglycan-associated protein
MTKRVAHGVALPAVAALLIACSIDAQAGMEAVRMFEHAPSVEELREVVRPDVPIRTRGIEVMGGATVRAARRRPDMTGVVFAPPIGSGASRSEIVVGVPPLRPQPTPPEVLASGGEPHEPREPASSPGSAAALAAPASPPPAQDPPAAAAFGFNITFAFNSADIPEEFRGHVDAVGNLMKQEGGVGLRIEGHTDATGSEAYNEGLSRRRAVAVQRYLMEVHGIAAERLVARGLGERSPLVVDPHAAANRRVQFARIR